ncbi:MAG: nitroreductase family deazaflavin-dependent oxidoreductase [Candidatus Dormibacteraeota bacterium]|nr:nitroreductase family deazaflavin-dependent oxidoreductase [Candidatus Dormibacteraeota bacterium]
MSKYEDFNQQVIAEFRAKGGRGVENFGDRLLLLTTTGAKSGTVRTHPVAYTPVEAGYVIVGSKGGAPTHPAWYHNLVAHPEATVEVGTDHFPVRARVVHGEEYERLFSAHAERMPAFREYTHKTSRTLPTIVLERVSQPAVDLLADAPLNSVEA